MNVKIVEQEKKKVELPFPRLMKSIKNHHIVLFTEERVGICIGNAQPSMSHRRVDIGYGSTFWIMKNFEDFKGTVTLENDAL